MKLGIFLLVFGLILAAIGVFLWQSGIGAQSTTWGIPNYGLEARQQGQLTSAAGLGVLVLGGGLALGGIVRMIVKR